MRFRLPFMPRGEWMSSRAPRSPRSVASRSALGIWWCAWCGSVSDAELLDALTAISPELPPETLANIGIRAVAPA